MTRTRVESTPARVYARRIASDIGEMEAMITELLELERLRDGHRAIDELRLRREQSASHAITDGIRGRANRFPMTAEVAMRVGMAAGALP